jgi:hypothetical protein
MGDSFSKPSSTTTAIGQPRPGLMYNPVYKIDLVKNASSTLELMLSPIRLQGNQTTDSSQ